MNAYADLMRSYSQVYAALALRGRRASREEIDWSDWNHALAIVSMMARTPVAVQALQVDEALWRLAVMTTGAVGGEDWRALREPLEAAVLKFVNLARTELGSRGQALTRLTGRPDPSDELWTQRELQ